MHSREKTPTQEVDGGRCSGGAIDPTVDLRPSVSGGKGGDASSNPCLTTIPPIPDFLRDSQGETTSDDSGLETPPQSRLSPKQIDSRGQWGSAENVGQRKEVEESSVKVPDADQTLRLRIRALLMRSPYEEEIERPLEIRPSDWYSIYSEEQRVIASMGANFWGKVLQRIGSHSNDPDRKTFASNLVFFEERCVRLGPPTVDFDYPDPDLDVEWGRWDISDHLVRRKDD